MAELRALERPAAILAAFTTHEVAFSLADAQAAVMELQRARERQAQEQKREREAAERRYRREIIGDFVLAKPTVMHVNDQDYAVPAGRHAIVGEIAIVDGELRRAGVVYHTPSASNRRDVGHGIRAIPSAGARAG